MFHLTYKICLFISFSIAVNNVLLDVYQESPEHNGETEKYAGLHYNIKNHFRVSVTNQ